MNKDSDSHSKVDHALHDLVKVTKINLQEFT